VDLQSLRIFLNIYNKKNALQVQGIFYYCYFLSANGPIPIRNRDGYDASGPVPTVHVGEAVQPSDHL
jgi:hypothetical protein